MDKSEAGHDIAGEDSTPKDGLMTKGGNTVRAISIQFGGGMVKTCIDYLFKISKERVKDLQRDYGNKDKTSVMPKDNASKKAGAKIIGRVTFDAQRPKNQPNEPTK